MRHRVAFFVASVLVAAPSVAFAQSDDCPPGSWFCEGQESEADEGAADESAEPDAETGDSSPDVVVYEPAEKSKKAPDKIIVVDRTEPPRPATRGRHCARRRTLPSSRTTNGWSRESHADPPSPLTTSRRR